MKMDGLDGQGKQGNEGVIIICMRERERCHIPLGF
jgi:hypothetical protein